MSAVSSPIKASIQPANNPLLIGQGLPPFSEIKSEHVVPGIEQLLRELAQALQTLEEDLVAALQSSPQFSPSWHELIDPLTVITERLGWSWGIISHLMGVKNSPELRSAYESVQPALVQFANEMSQSQVIYDALKRLRSDAGWDALVPAQQRIVEAALRDAELSGVGLTGEAKDKFNEIQQSLAELSTQFSNHVLDATKAFSLTLSEKDEVAGLPPSLLSLTAQAAREAGAPDSYPEATPESGPWRITLDMPCYVPFLRHAQRRDLREKLYRASITRASSGDLDNAPLIEQILALRKQQAALLGFENYAELSLARKMAPSVAAVEALMEELRLASYDAAVRELADIKAFAQDSLETSLDSSSPSKIPPDIKPPDIKQWDLPFWSERMREREFDLSDEALRPYFPLPRVLEGLFGLAERLFGIRISAADNQAPIWHPDVRYFQVADADQGEVIAHFYLDPFSRPAEKRGGAWMDECIVRAGVGSGAGSGAAGQSVRLPVAYLICNQSPPIDDKPSLMTFGEVETLFHEFGHGLQHMLTRVDYPGAAGINNVEWDAVELPSQFMENWCYERETLFGMARHYETGEPLPEADYQKLLAARHFMTGNAILRQVNFGWVDMALHSQYQPGGEESVGEVRDRIAQKTVILEPLREDASLCSFGHIFSGGYAAGYYSYFWAEVLSADAFAAFEEAGLEDKANIAAIGRRFRDTVLALGGSRHPMAVFKAFRGREPSTQALLRHRGLMIEA